MPPRRYIHGAAAALAYAFSLLPLFDIERLRHIIRRRHTLLLMLLIAAFAAFFDC